jgi:hypothetical protein
MVLYIWESRWLCAPFFLLHLIIVRLPPFNRDASAGLE